MPRLYNPITEEILLLPKGGTYHLSSHTKLGKCKICQSELIIYQLSDHRKYPLCAWCYNHPQEDIWGPAPYPITSSSSSTRSASSICYEAPLGDLHPINYDLSICSLINENELLYESKGEYHKIIEKEEVNTKNNGKTNNGKNITKNISSGGGVYGSNQLSSGGVLILEPTLSLDSNIIRFISTRSEVSFTLPRAIDKVELLSVENFTRSIKVK